MQKKLALVGCGEWGAKIARTIEASKHLHLHTIISSKPRSVIETIVPGFAGTHIADYRALTDMRHEIDGVVIATPPAGREQIIDHLLDYGIAILAEKPMTLNAHTTASLVAKARSANIVLAENFVHLFSWAFLLIWRRSKKSGYIEVRSRGLNHGPFRNYSPIYDYGPHDLALVLQTFDRTPESLAVQTFKWENDGRFCTRVHMSFGHRGVATLEFGNTYSGKRRLFECRHDGETWQYDDTHPRKLLRDGTPFYPENTDTRMSTIERALLNFTGIEPLYSRAKSLWLIEKVSKLTGTIIKRARSGAPIEMP